MSRRYTEVKAIEKELMELKASGRTNREIAEAYVLEKSQIKELVKRHNRHRRKTEAGITPRPKGRPRKQPSTDEAENLKQN